MRRILVMLVAALSFASLACCKKEDVSEALTKMTEFKDKMCACEDKTCIERVTDDMTKWGTEQKVSNNKQVNESEKDMKKMMEIGDAMTECMTKVRKSAARTSTEEVITKVKKNAARASIEEALAKMSEFRDEMCVCKDRKCTDKVTEDMTKWGSDQKNHDNGEKVSEADTKKMMEISEGMTECMDKVIENTAKASVGETIAKMTEFKDRMCGCEDKTCTNKVVDDMTKWGSERKSSDNETKVSEEDTRKMMTISEEMTKCMTNAMTGAARGDGDKSVDMADPQ